jgi:hypothetical protein
MVKKLFVLLGQYDQRAAPYLAIPKLGRLRKTDITRTRYRVSGLFRQSAIQFTVSFVLLLLTASFAASGGGVTFHDIAAGGGAGISYRRVRSATQAIFDLLKTKDPYTFDDLFSSPVKARGAPGVAMFDFDGDGDLDIYVTNGPGRANSLYSNQLRETGQLSFMDVAAGAGVAATDQDSTGVCYGDIDNDGDHDLLVLGRSEPNRLFKNLGDGTFADITAGSGLGEDSLGPCLVRAGRCQWRRPARHRGSEHVRLECHVCDLR